MSDLFTTGIRPAIDEFLLKKSQEERDYGNYWSASSAGYCMRKNIFDRLKVPKGKVDARKTRVFESGHIFHEWMQRITKNAGLSIAQELELQDEGLMVRGHIDDLVLISDDQGFDDVYGGDGEHGFHHSPAGERHLILYDYKTVNSRAFSWAKKSGDAMSHFHKMQVGTYMYMLRKPASLPNRILELLYKLDLGQQKLEEARILKISKDDLRMGEQQLLWSPELEKEVVQYWTTLNGYWKNKQFPACTCADREGGFMAREAYNDYFYNDKPCSLEWAIKCHNEGKVNINGWKVKN